jgi:hypothetical protein
MVIEDEFKVIASAQRTWDFLMNIGELTSCIPSVQKVEVFDTAGFDRLAEELQQRIAKSEEYARRRDIKAGGASAGCFATDRAGISGVRNYQQAGGFEGIDNFDPSKVAPKYYDGRVACFGCPVGCSMRYTIKDGPYAGEWGTKIEHGIYPNSPALLTRTKGEILFFGLYYVMTGLHGLHVLVGVVALSAMLRLVLRKRINQTRFVPLENAGLYWHLVDIIWIFLFPLFYLIT